jgi:raffinose/stachyose/melibiose transport system substrate-binding protein
MKKNAVAVCAVVAVVCVALGFTGCAKKAVVADKGYDLYFFNTKGENAAQVDAMVKAYEAETGVRVKAFSIGATQNSIGPLINEMNSKNMPTIFCMEGLGQLDMWLDGGYVTDLSTVTHPAFAKLAREIPENLRFSNGGTAHYGVPFNIEGYGWIVDRQMLADIFGAPNVDPVLASFKTATWAEWEAFVKAADSWIQNPAAATVTLSGTTYRLPASKTGLAANLTGVDVVQGSVKWTFASHFLNVALNAVFNTMGDAYAASDDKIREIRGPMTAYARALDLKSTYAAGKNGPAHRGQDMVSPSNYGYDQSVQLFADSKALFIKQGNWAYGNIAKVNAAMAERLTFIPVKMPLTQADITVPGRTVASMERSIPIFVPNVYAVNALCPEDEKNKAYDFLVWMNTSKTGQHFIIDEMAFIPYNADPATTTVPNSLGNSIIAYLNAGDMLGGVWMGAPQPWSQDNFGKMVMENYLTKPVWTQADYDAIGTAAVDMWIQLKHQ